MTESTMKHELSARIRNRLNRQDCDISRPETVAALGYNEILRIPDFGEKSVKELRSWLQERGLDLKDAPAVRPPRQQQPRFTEWQPIASAPKDGTFVLLFFPDQKHGHEIGWFHESVTMEYGKFARDCKKWMTMRWPSMGGWSKPDPEPSHWMPLPARPVAHLTKR